MACLRASFIFSLSRRQIFLIPQRFPALLRLPFMAAERSTSEGALWPNDAGNGNASYIPGCTRAASYGCVLPANALSITSPIGCHMVPSNWTRRICLMGWKSVGPVLNVMFGSASEFR